jgi:ABC-2 type transport system permease protein
VDLLLIVATWASPILYPWTFVRDEIGPGWLLELYMANPLTIAAQLFQRAFWTPTASELPDPAIGGPTAEAPTVGFTQLIPELYTRGVVALLASCLVLLLGQLAFSRLEGRFAQEL